MLEGVTVINEMADGTICEDLSTYCPKGPLPDIVQRIMLDMMREGHKIRMQQQKEAADKRPEP